MKNTEDTVIREKISTKKIGERIDYLDALRTAACFTVVMLHVAALNTYHVEFRSHEWNIFMCYESIVNWAVPEFVMISGAVLLRKQYTYHILLKKALRLVFIFVIWSFIYLVSDIICNGIDSYRNAVWLQVLLQGHYHMWYLIMLSGLYCVLPILKEIVDRPVLRRTFVILSIVFTFAIPSLRALPQLDGFGNVLQIPAVGVGYRVFFNIVDDINFHLTIGYVSYLVIGYAISSNKYYCNSRTFLIGTTMVILGTLLAGLEIKQAVSKEAAGVFMQYYQVSIVLQSCGIMMIAKALSGTKIVHFLATLSPLMLGIYLVHPLIIEVMQKQGITSMMFNPICSVPVLTFLVFSIAAIIIKIMMTTPLERFVRL